MHYFVGKVLLPLEGMLGLQQRLGGWCQDPRFSNRRWYCTEMSSVILFLSRCFNLVADQSIQILLLMIVGEVNLCEVKI